MAMLPTMLEDERKRGGWSVGQTAWRLGVSIREYQEIAAGARSPSASSRALQVEHAEWVSLNESPR